MALYTLKPSVQRIAGSRGGSTFTKTPAGYVIRRRFKPSNPMTVKQQRYRANFFTASKFNYALSQNQKDQNEQRALDFPRTNSLGMTYYMSGSNLITSQNKVKIDVNSPLIFVARPPSFPPNITSFGSGWSIDPDSLGVSFTLMGDPTAYLMRISLTPSGDYPFLPNYTTDLRIALEVPANTLGFIDLLPSYIALYGSTRWKVGQTMVVGLQFVRPERGYVSPYHLFTIGLAP